MSNKVRIIFIAALAVFIIGAIISGAIIIGYHSDASANERLNDEISQMVTDVMPAQPAGHETASELLTVGRLPSTEGAGLEDVPVLSDGHHNSDGRLYRFLDVGERYEDFVGWITIGEEGENEINLPVVQSDDNEYYLDHSVSGEENRYGAIFMDYMNDPRDLGHNTYLYGHHYQGDDQMFAKLTEYHHEDYALENSVFYFATAYDEYDCYIFSSYTIYPDDWRLYAVDFTGDEDFMDYVGEALDNSDFDYGVDVMAGDSILSLSTCDYQFSDARLIIHAKLVKKTY